MPEYPASLSFAAAATSSPSTLTLQIPFHLLFTHNIPKDIYTHGRGNDKVLAILSAGFNSLCPGVPVVIWTPSNQPVIETAANRYESEERRSKRLQDHGERMKKWEIEEVARFEEVSRNSWVLRQADNSSIPDATGLVRWRDGEGRLNEAEKRAVGRDLWTFPVVLQRCGVVLTEHDRQSMESELRALCRVLRQEFKYAEDEDGGVSKKMDEEENGRINPTIAHDGEDGKPFYWRVVCSEDCWLRVQIVPNRARTPVTKAHGDDSELEAQKERRIDQAHLLDVAAKTLLLVIAFERELLLLTRASAVLAHWPLSRFLEHVSIKHLRRETRNKWRVLRGRERGGVRDEQEHDWLQGDVNSKAYEDHELGLWTVITQMVKNKGEERLGNLLREMARFEDEGRKLGVSFELEKEVKKKQDQEHDEDQDQDEQNTTMNPNKTHVRPENPPPPPPYVPPTIKSIIFQDHNTTLDADKLFAYIDLVTRIVDYASQNIFDTIKRAVEYFREGETNNMNSIDRSLERFLSLMLVDPRTTDTLVTLVRKFGVEEERRAKEEEDVDVDNVEFIEKKDARDKLTFKNEDPTLTLLTFLVKTRKREEAYMLTFIERYAKAGGFHVVPLNKLHHLLSAQDKGRDQADKTNKEIRTRGKARAGKDTQTWLRGLGSVDMDMGDDPKYDIGSSGFIATSPILSAASPRPRSISPASSPPRSRPSSSRVASSPVSPLQSEKNWKDGQSKGKDIINQVIHYPPQSRGRDGTSASRFGSSSQRLDDSPRSEDLWAQSPSTRGSDFVDDKEINHISLLDDLGRSMGSSVDGDGADDEGDGGGSGGGGRGDGNRDAVGKPREKFEDVFGKGKKGGGGGGGFGMG
ncbi:hypothetical protein K504DRAFT_538216 [Pleomassaria siparia CBS 279.74]|uniref:Uncharacterized protein n=1 Tax=Pleomassaria siparia CBS 279.74 TaxID=1314801 RepID=A0A6G1JUD8_9PLEO|nr:hypothetical protein K504DRAFT_538216 [Pleomassaria siparia CBS 279.74]